MTVRAKIIFLFVLMLVPVNGQMINRYGTTAANFLEIGVGSDGVGIGSDGDGSDGVASNGSIVVGW